MRRTVISSSIIAGMVALLAGQASAITPSFSIALRATNTVPGVGNVTLINGLSVNNQGKWLIEADTDNADTNADVVVLLNGVVQFRENQALAAPAGATISSFDSVHINNNADVGWNLFLRGLTTTTDSGIFFNSTLAIQESNVSASPSFTNPTPYIGFFESKMNDMNQMAVIASVDDPGIASTVDRAIVRVDYNAGAGTYVENVIMKEADLILGNAIADFGTSPHTISINNSGSILYQADTTAATAVDGFLMLNNTVLAQEGTTSTGGSNVRTYETVLSRGSDLNGAGDWIIRANMTGDTLTDEAIVKNNEIVYQEGQNLPAIGAFTLESFGLAGGSLQIDGAGNIVWYGDWNDPATTMDSGLFWNDQLIVQEGVTMIGGFLVQAIANGEDAFEVSDNGQWLLFEATLRDVAAGINYNSAVLVQIPAPAAGALVLAAGLIGLRRRRA